METIKIIYNKNDSLNDSIVIIGFPSVGYASVIAANYLVSELEMEYELATKGLTKGLPATFAAMLSGLMSLLASAVVLVMTGKTRLTGSQPVIIFGILATASIHIHLFVYHIWKAYQRAITIPFWILSPEFWLPPV